MNLLNSTPRPSTRLNRGNVVMANAELVDTRPVKARFEVFKDIQRRYVEAHNKVAEAEALETVELKRIEQLDGALKKSLSALSAALLLDGEPQRNTFGRFAPHGPGQMARMSFVDRVTAVQSLGATLRCSMGLSDATLAAADKAEQAAAVVKEALPGWKLRRTYLNMARQGRDSLGLQWDVAYRALRHASLSAVEAPGLHAILFAQPKRSTKKAKVVHPVDQATTVADAEPAEGSATDESRPAKPQAA